MALSRLENGSQRKPLTTQAEKQGWNSLELEKRVSAVVETQSKSVEIDGNGGEIFLNNTLLENGHAIRMHPSSQENGIP